VTERKNISPNNRGKKLAPIRSPYIRKELKNTLLKKVWIRDIKSYMNRSSRKIINDYQIIKI
jgi:hypothetical protein